VPQPADRELRRPGGQHGLRPSTLAPDLADRNRQVRSGVVSTPSAPASERERDPTPIERLLVWARHRSATQSPAGQFCRCIRRRPATIETSEPSFAIAQSGASGCSGRHDCFYRPAASRSRDCVGDIALVPGPHISGRCATSLLPPNVGSDRGDATPRANRWRARSPVCIGTTVPEESQPPAPHVCPAADYVQ
jgi:hypothetical protein